ATKHDLPAPAKRPLPYRMALPSSPMHGRRQDGGPKARIGGARQGAGDPGLVAPIGRQNGGALWAAREMGPHGVTLGTAIPNQHRVVIEGEEWPAPVAADHFSPVRACMVSATGSLSLSPSGSRRA